MKVQVYTDGGARGNPGPAGIGAVILDTAGKILAEISRFLGETTNNQAEYQALRAALTKAKELGATEVDCYLDSELIVKQMNRAYRVKDPDLIPLFLSIHNLSVTIGTVRFSHIPREQNAHADALVNRAIDSHSQR